MIYLTRHGQTLFNVEGRLQGKLDSPLSDEGRRQARAQGRMLRRLTEGKGISSIACSPLGRARDTAGIIAEEMGIGEIATDDRLMEVSFGEWDGLTAAEIDAGWPGQRHPSPRFGWARGCPGSEPYEDALARVCAWLADQQGKTAIAVSHGVTSSLIRGVYARLSRNEMLELLMPQDAVFTLSGGNIEQIDCAF